MEAEDDGNGESDDHRKGRPAIWKETGITGPARRSSRGNWKEEEDELLQDAVQRFKGKCWKKIAECVPNRTDVQCLHRWQKVLNPDVVKGPWTKKEDDHIIEFVHKQGCRKWSELAKLLPGRIGKQCRERWYNHLNPEINRNPWTREEELILFEAHSKHGNKWVEIAKLLHGRSENSIKNHWNCNLKKKLEHNLYHSGFASRHYSRASTSISSHRGLCYEPLQANDDLIILCAPASPESILKRAAMSFQNIPSIIRKPRNPKHVMENAIDSANSTKCQGKCFHECLMGM